MNSDIRYFMFSKEQQNLQKEVSRKLGKNFVPSKVITLGKALEFTEILKDPNKSRFSDAKLVASGEISTMKYTIG